jgi:uncharacterized membrane protein YbhN (UPF0104 family)
MALRIAGSALILALLFLVLPFDQLVAALARVPVWVWVVSVPGYLILHLVGIAKWRLLINAAQGGLRMRDAARCYYFGLFSNTFLPSLIGGDAVRAGLALKLASSKGGVLLGSFLDRMIDVLGLAVIAAIGALLVPGALNPESRAVFWTLGGLLGAGALVGLALLFSLPVRRFPRKARRMMVKARRLLYELRRRPAAVVAALLMCIGLQTSLVALNWWLGLQCGIDIAFTTWLFAWPMAKVSALLPVTQGGIGVREAALAALLAPFGVPAALAVAAGLVFQGVVFSGGLIGGALSVIIGRSTPTAASIEGDAAHGYVGV